MAPGVAEATGAHTRSHTNQVIMLIYYSGVGSGVDWGSLALLARVKANPLNMLNELAWLIIDMNYELFTKTYAIWPCGFGFGFQVQAGEPEASILLPQHGRLSDSDDELII